MYRGIKGEVQGGERHRMGLRGDEGGAVGVRSAAGASAGGVVAGCAWERKVGMKEVQRCSGTSGRRRGCSMCM
jgi:hypothetical protein